MRPTRHPARAGSLVALIGALVAGSCDNPLASSSTTIDRIDVTPAGVALVAGETRPITARIIDGDGKTVNDRRVFWSTQNPAVATVSEAGVVTAVGPGNTQVAANAGGKSGVVAVTVGARPVSLVRVTPSASQILAGASTTLQAEAVDAAGGTITGRPVIWNSSSSAIATVTSTGVVSGVTPGTVTITATIDGVNGSGVVTVLAVPVASVGVTPASEQVVVGQAVQLSATTRDAQNNILTGRVVAWASSNVAVASVSSTGLVTGISAGSCTITATSEGKSGTAQVTVALVPVDSVTVSPAQATIAGGQTLQLTARATDARGAELTGRTVEWTSAQPTIATVSPTGLVTGITAGATRIVATIEGKSASALITVTPVPVARIEIKPTAASLFIGQKEQFTATTLDADGHVLPGRQVTWISGAPTVAAVDKTGLVTAVGAGSAVIFAASEGQSANVIVEVGTVVVASVRVTPPSASLQQGAGQQFSAQALDAQGNILAGRIITWSSSDNTVATVSSSGLVVGISAGTATITAGSGGATGTASVTITPVNVASVSILPASATVQVASTQPLSVVLADASGNPISPVGRVITWSSNNTPVATVDASGVVTGVSAGSATISASNSGKTGTAAITVTNVPVANVTVTANSSALTVGQTTGVTATARDAGGATLTGRPVSWNSSNPAVASLNTATTAETNTITAVGAGTTTITATVSGVQGVAVITVTIVPIASVSVTPSPGTVQEGQTLQLTVTLRDASNNVLPTAGRTIIWSSNNAQLSVSQGGLVTAVANSGGQAATITVSAPGGGAGGTTPSGTADITATYIPVATVNVSPGTASVPPLGSTTFSASLLGPSGQSLPATGRSVSFSSSNPLVASVNPTTGVATGILPGSVTITATASSPGQLTPATGTATLTVTLAPVANVTLSPGSGTVYVGATYARTFTALVQDAGGNALSSRTVNFTSGSSAIATVSPSSATTDGSGQAQVTVTGVTVGQVFITASASSVNGTSNVTIALVPVSSIDVAPLSASLAPGGTQQLTATPRDSAGTVISGAPLGGRATSWHSDNTAAATVSGTGLVTAVGGGTATITATVGGTVSATPSVVTVVVPVSAVTLGVPADSVIVGGTLQGTVTVLGAGNVPLSGRSVSMAGGGGIVTFSSPALTNASGQTTVTVTGASVGTTTITASSGGQTSSGESIRVLVPVATVEVSPAAQTIVQGNVFSFGAMAKDAGGNAVPGRPITWSLSNGKASLSTTTGASTSVTGVDSGTVVLTATAEGKAGTATITVTLVPVDVILADQDPVALSVSGTGVPSSVNVTFTVQSSSGTPLAGRAIAVAAQGAGNSIVGVSPASGVTDSNGQFTVTFLAKAAGAATVRASAGGKFVDVTATVVP